MPVANKIAALFSALTQEELDAMPPAERRRFADTCRHWAERADRAWPTALPKGGVVKELNRGDRSL
jgi:hypothetical protein